MAGSIYPTAEIYKSIIWQIRDKLLIQFKSVEQFSMNNVSKMICSKKKNLGYNTVHLVGQNLFNMESFRVSFGWKEDMCLSQGER